MGEVNKASIDREEIGTPTSVGKSSSMPRLVKVLFFTEALIGAAFILVRQLPKPPVSLLTITNLASEATLPAWFSSLQLALVAVLFLCFFVSERGRGTKAWGLLLAAGVFLFLSLDEAAQLHELLSGVLHERILGKNLDETPLSKTGYWMFMLAPILVAVLLIIWRWIRHYLSGQRARWKLFSGIAIFLISATVPEIISNFLSPGSSLLMLELVVEEIGEMAGITLVVWGVYELLEAFDVRLDFRGS